MIESSPNSTVGWQPRDIHSTSLRACGPDEYLSNVHEVGVAFSCSPRLAEMWMQYITAAYSDDEWRRIEAELGDPDVDDGYNTDCEFGEGGGTAGLGNEYDEEGDSDGMED